MRFKVGQKVRVVKPYSKSAFYDGEIVEIMGISQNAYRGQSCYRAVSCENEEKGWWCLCEDEVEPIPVEYKAAPITNGDKIRSMSNREMAEFLSYYKEFSCEICPRNPITCAYVKNGCEDGMIAWLNSEAE